MKNSDVSISAKSNDQPGGAVPTLPLRRRHATSEMVRRRFIDETTRLVRQHGFEGVSTRLICEAVGVKPPTLYHHFGDLRSLHDAIVDHAFTSFMMRWQHSLSSDDPLVRIRSGWDAHIAFSQDEPALYSIIAMQNVAGKIPRQILAAHHLTIENFKEVERTSSLAYAPEQAAQILTAACLGASIVANLDLPRFDELSGVMREDVIRAILGERQEAGRPEHPAERASACM